MRTFYQSLAGLAMLVYAASASAALGDVADPKTFVLLLIGLIGLGLVRHRKNA